MPEAAIRAESESADCVLSVEGYGLSYATAHGPVRVLEGIDLQIKRGEVLGLVGESGSGKSSLAYAIMRGLPGRIAEEQGRILFNQQDVQSLDDAALRALHGNRLSMVFQNAATALNPTQTLGEHVIEVLRKHQGLDADAARRRTCELFEQVRLTDPQAMLSRYAHQISGGEKQRVVLATAFACDPDLILFDEPTSALDATTAATLLDLFRELQLNTGVAALFISHDLGVIASIAHRVAVIHQGRIVEYADTDELFTAPQHLYTQTLLANLPKPSHVGVKPLQMSSDTPVLTAESIQVQFTQKSGWRSYFGGKASAVHAVNNVDLHLVKGETLGLVGESGCGKSSLARALVSLNEYSGSVSINAESNTNTDIKTDKNTSSKIANNDALKQIQIIFQNPDSSLNPRHRIGLLLERPLKLYRTDLDADGRAAAIRELLARVNLPAGYVTRYPHELSGGEKQRVAIARAIAARPAVIICDEITSGLDVTVQSAIINLLREIQADTGVALLFITHDLNVLRQIAHRVAVMYLGEIVEQRPATKLSSPPYHPYTEALLSSVPVVDTAVETRRVRLSGDMPKRTAATIGCPFASRCSRVIEQRCSTERPPVRLFDADVSISCHLSTQQLLQVQPIWKSTGKLQEKPV